MYHVLIFRVLQIFLIHGSFAAQFLYSASLCSYHCMKSVQKRSFFWSVFSRFRIECFVSLRIQSECGKIRTRKNSVFGHISHSVPPLPLCADYMQYICKIGTSLHPFPCTMNTTSRCLILCHKHIDSTKQFFSFGDTKSDHNRQKRHNELRYVTMKCDKAQRKLDF